MTPSAKWLHQVCFNNPGEGLKGARDKFHKRFFVYDSSLGSQFFQQMHVHNNMNPNPKIMMETF